MKTMSTMVALAFAALTSGGPAAAETPNQNPSRSNHANLSDGGAADADGAAGVQDHNSSRSNKSASVAAPRDGASGLATGKRQHKPMTASPDLDADAAAQGR